MSIRAEVPGVILAGGRSARMGRDKSLLPVGGVRLIEHTVRLMKACFERIIICSDFPDKYRFLNLEIIPDLHKDVGPLGGIHSALSHARTELVFVASCDTPLLPSSLIDYILDVDSPKRTRIPRHLGFLQPLCGLYEKKWFHPIEKNIAQGDHSVLHFLAKADFAAIEITPDLPFYSPEMFSNVNSPEDYARIQELFKKSSPEFIAPVAAHP